MKKNVVCDISLLEIVFPWIKIDTMYWAVIVLDTPKPGEHHIDGLVQDCSNSIANAMELLQSCNKPSI